MDHATREFNRLIGRRLRDARILRGLSQEKLGKIIGVTFQQVQKYENGANRVSAQKVKAFAEALGVTVNHFLGAPVIELPDVEVSSQRLLKLFRALQQLEAQRPASFLPLYHFIISLAKVSDQ